MFRRINWILISMLALVFSLSACGVEEDPGPTGEVLALEEPTFGAGSGLESDIILLPNSGSLSDEERLRVGEALYEVNCAPCHQENGEGVINLFPALNRNPFILANDPRPVIQTVLYGRNVMPGFKGSLTDGQIAAILSYARNAWNNNVEAVTVDQVQSVSESGSNE